MDLIKKIHLIYLKRTINKFHAEQSKTYARYYHFSANHLYVRFDSGGDGQLMRVQRNSLQVS